MIGTLAGTIEELQRLRVQLLTSATQLFETAVGADDVGWNNVRTTKEYWRRTILQEGLKKIGLLLDKLEVKPQTIFTLSVARYVFEFMIWLRLLELDDRYGLVFFYRLLINQERHLNDLMNNAHREIALFERLGEKEELVHKEELEKLVSSGADNSQLAQLVAEANKRTEKAIDFEARKNFATYADQAAVNGYGFQAYLIKTQLIPQAEVQLKAIIAEKTCFQSLDEKTQSFVVSTAKNWKWKSASNAAGMGGLYDFIYTYTSRLLHAEPMSFVSTARELGEVEHRVLLDFVCTAIIDCLDITAKYIGHARSQ
jgi:hypothetical protein